MTDKYFKCEHCNEFFGANKARKYCSRKCRDAAYYKRKSCTGFRSIEAHDTQVTFNNNEPTITPAEETL